MDYDLDYNFDPMNASQVTNFHLDADCQNNILTALWDPGCYSDGSYEIFNGTTTQGIDVWGDLLTTPFSNKQNGFHVYINGQINTVSPNTYSLIVNNNYQCYLPPPEQTDDCYVVSAFKQVDSYGATQLCYPFILGKVAYQDGYNDPEILINPNPASNTLEILIANINYSNMMIYLYDNNSRLLKQLYINKRDAQNPIIDISNLSNGIYFIRIDISLDNGNNKTILKKLIVNK